MDAAQLQVIGIDASGRELLRALYYDSVVALFHHARITRGIALLVRGLAAVDLRRHDRIGGIDVVVPQILVVSHHVVGECLPSRREHTRRRRIAAEEAGDVVGRAAHQADRVFGDAFEAAMAAPKVFRRPRDHVADVDGLAGLGVGHQADIGVPMLKIEDLGQRPGGALGRQLLRVRDVMRTGTRNPTVRWDTSLRETAAAHFGSGWLFVVVRDGKIIAAAQEERSSRGKHDASFPARAVAYCLREAGLSPSDLDYVAYYEKPLVKFERLLETYLSYAPRGLPSFRAAMPAWLGEKLHLRRVIRDGLGGTTSSALTDRFRQGRIYEVGSGMLAPSNPHWKRSIKREGVRWQHCDTVWL